MKIRNSVIGLCISVLAFTTAIQADQEGFTVGAGANFLDLDDIGSENELGLNLGYQFAGPLGIEASRIPIDGNRSATGIDLLYNFVDNRKYAFYGSLGAGEFDLGSVDEDFAALGLGIKGYLTDNIAVRLGLKGIDADSDTRNGTDTLAALGLEYNFGSYDKGASKQTNKISTPVAAVPADTDKDGVVDTVDQCPTSAAGITVDARGCEIDSDYDGVVDSLDNCKDTKVGAKVDANGCYVLLKEAKQIELKVNFPTNSNEVAAEYFTEIAQVATFMKEYPNTSVVVEGHTDSRGSAAYNKSLSQKRATMIASILVDKYNVEQSRVSAKGYGEERPIASNDNAEGRAANRRVVAVINTVVEKIAE